MLPSNISRYKIKDRLGVGGMATVYRAFDPQFQREVAIKVLPREFMHREEFLARFQREARTIAALEHPAIVPVYDFGDDNGQPFLTMRLMTGGSLKELLLKGPLTLEEIARLFSRLAPALDYAHKKGVIHRDLKPGNILFDQHGEPYLADFGIVRLTGTSTTLTGGGIVGTPAYMSPEQGRGAKEIDHRTDIYALGSMLFEMLTGRIPYESDTPTGQIVQHITEPIPDVLKLKPTLPSDCQRIVAQAMAKQPGGRFNTVSEMAATLTSVAHGQSLPSPQKTISVPVSEPKPLPDEAPPRPSPGKSLAKPVRSRSFPRWAWIGLGLIPVLICLVSTGILTAMFFTTEPTPTPTLSATFTSSPTSTPTIPIPPTDIVVPAASSTVTPAPPPHSITIEQVDGLMSVKIGTADPQLAEADLILPADAETLIKTSGKAEFILEDATRIFLGANTDFTLFAEREGLETNLLQTGTVLIQGVQWVIKSDDLAYQAQLTEGWMGVVYISNPTRFIIDCLAGSCQIGDLTLSDGQRAGYTDTILGEVEPAEYDYWIALGGPEVPTATPEATPTNTITPRPVNTVQPTSVPSTAVPPTKTPKPTDPLPTAIQPPTNTTEPPTPVPPPALQ